MSKSLIEINKEYIEKLKELITSGDEVATLEMIESVHAADIADIYDSLTVDEETF